MDLPYITPHQLNRRELFYEAFIRGISEPETFTHEALCRLVHQHQMEEMRTGSSPETLVSDMNGELAIIMDAMAEISSIHSREVQMGPVERDGIRNRLIHLLNRSRRIQTKTRTQKAEVGQVIATVERARVRWGPREGIVPEVTRVTPPSRPEATPNGSDHASLSRLATPEPAQHGQHQQSVEANAPLFHMNAMVNSTPTRNQENGSLMPVGSSSTTMNTIQRPTILDERASNQVSMPSALRDPSSGTHASNKQLRFTEESDRQKDIQQYLTRTSQAYAHAAAVCAEGETSHLESSRYEHQKLLDQIQSLMYELQRTQLMTTPPSTSTGVVAGSYAQPPHQVGHSVPKSNGPSAPSPNTSEAEPRSTEVDDPERTVFRHQSNPQYAIRKQISPDRWGFVFSGEESQNKRDTPPQHFLAQLESNRLAEGYTKATISRS